MFFSTGKRLANLVPFIRKSLWRVSEAYSVTPYTHILVYHVPDMMQSYGSIKYFSGQGYLIFNYLTCLYIHVHCTCTRVGVEKNNDDAKRNYYSSNRHDACRDILLAEARLEMLRRGIDGIQSCVRQKRTYTKKSTAYWHEGGIMESRKRPHNSNT